MRIPEIGTAHTGTKRTLSPEHRRTLEVGSAITRKVLEENCVRSVVHGRELPEGFSGRQRKRGSGILFTNPRPNGETGYSFRPDDPDPKNPGRKYEQPCKALGAPGNVLALPAEVQHLIADTSVPVVFVEGIKKMLAVVSAARRAGAVVLVIAISGVWNWLSEGKPIADMLDIPVEGREVYIGFDSDVFRNPGVGDAARGLWRHLQGRGATVYLSYLPDQTDGSKTGADDFLAASHTYGDYVETFRPFDAGDLYTERLKRDARLRLALADLERRFWRFDWSGMGPHSARDVALVLLEAAWIRGKLVPDGVEVAMAWGPLEVAARVSRRTLAKALDYLEEWDIAYRVKDGRKPGKRGAFVLRAKVYQYGEGPENVESSTPIGIPCRAPRLRYSSPGTRPRRGLVPGTRKVRQGPPRKPKPAVKRPGKIRGGMLDHLDRAGGELTLLELDEAMRPDKAPEKRRPRDLTRRKNPQTGKGRDGLLIMWIDAGVVQLDGATVRLAPDWLERLDDQRRVGGEIDAVDATGHVDAGADTIARRELEIRRREFLQWRERRQQRGPRKQSGTEAGRAAIERSRQKKAEGLVEAERRATEAAKTAELRRAEAFVLDRIQVLGRIRLALLQDVWRDEGGDPWTVSLAVEALGCRVEALPEYGNRRFVFAPSKGAA
jgi:hypothetical protein